jgi:hypothetical protein
MLSKGWSRFTQFALASPSTPTASTFPNFHTAFEFDLHIIGMTEAEVLLSDGTPDLSDDLS